MTSTLIHQPHDKLFKQAMAVHKVAREFFQEHLPTQLLNQFDLNTLQLEKQSFIDAAYKTTEADLIYRVQSNKNSAYIYLLCEQQTNIDHFITFRLWTYLIRLLENHHKKHPKDDLPLVYPLIVYAGEKVWNAPLEFTELFGEQKELMQEFWLKPCKLVDVYRLEDKLLQEHLLSGLLKYILKHRQARDFELFLETLLPWINKVEVEHDSSFSRIVLRYVMNGMEANDIQVFLDKSEAYLSEQLRGEVMTLAQQFEERGYQRGITLAEKFEERGYQRGVTLAEEFEKRGYQRGVTLAEEFEERGYQKGITKGITLAQEFKERGMRQGEATLLLKLLQRRFSTVPIQYQKAIEEADAETLLKWGERILEAKNLWEVFNQTESS